MFIAAFVAYYLRKRAQGKEHNAAFEYAEKHKVAIGVIAGNFPP